MRYRYLPAKSIGDGRLEVVVAYVKEYNHSDAALLVGVLKP